MRVELSRTNFEKWAIVTPADPRRVGDQMHQEAQSMSSRLRVFKRFTPCVSSSVAAHACRKAL